MRLPLLTIVALMVFSTTPALAQECEPNRQSPSRYCFALDLIESLRLGHNAYVVYGDSVGLAPCFADGAADVIYRAKQRAQAFTIAITFLLASAASPDSVIRSSREALMMAYATHLRAALDVQQYCRYFADGSLPPGFETPGQVADSAAQMRLRLNNATTLVIIAIGEISDGLTDMDPVTRKLTILRLSAEQRETLLTRMIAAFGPNVATFDRNNVRRLSTDFETAAGTFYDFLDEAWQLQPTRR